MRLLQDERYIALKQIKSHRVYILYTDKERMGKLYGKTVFR